MNARARTAVTAYVMTSLDSVLSLHKYMRQWLPTKSLDAHIVLKYSAAGDSERAIMA